MIKSIHLENFKNIKNSTIQFKNNISGIYGPNGTGKTTIIEAIDLLRFYFIFSKDITTKDFVSKEIDKIQDLIKKDSDILNLEVELLRDGYIYKLKISLTKDDINGIIILEESILYKENNPRHKFKKLIVVTSDANSLKPKVSLNVSHKTKDNFDFDFLEKTVFSQNETPLKTIVSNFNNLNSFSSILNKEIKNIYPNKELNDFAKHWNKIEETLMDITIFSLKEQALSNLEIAIPMSINLDNIKGTLPLNLNKNGNIYEEREYLILKETIEKINKLFSLLIPETKIIFQGELISKENKISKYAINIYVLKNNLKINIYNESTGTIKIFMLLSAIINVLKNKNAILLVDELDVHIFEYLLSFVLRKLDTYIQGQLIFTAHNLLPMESLDKNSIIISTKKDENIEYVYFKGKISPTANLRSKYLKSQYMWSEENIEPLLLRENLIEKTIRDMVKENEK